MTSKPTIASLILLALLTAAGYGLFATSQPVAPPPNAGSVVAAVSAPAVDQSSLNTAQALLRLPTTADEAPFARDALRLADKEMDLAFADAVRASARQFRTTTPAVQAIETRLSQARDALAADEARIADLTAASAKATGAAKGALDDRLALAKARHELDQDEADDASQDLQRAGGDPQGRMQAIMDEHEASSKSADTLRVIAVESIEPRGMVRRVQSWWALRQKELRLQAAKAAAESAAVVFAARHDSVERAEPQSVPLPAAATDSTRRPGIARPALSHDSASALLRITRRRDAQQKDRRRLDQHADNQHGLATAYERWTGVVRGQERVTINHLLRGITIILAIVLLALLIDRWIEHLLRTISTDRRRTQTMCMVVRVSLQIISVVLVLLVVFGTPGNLGTFLGLAGAGLTVALKDFIISFFGWFVLLGKDGVGIGDLVEINGVTGEVVELGMFHTVLLETGNWTDSGHPTGRRVTFTNSFAIEGHYFNFSTSGQWLWDEVRIVVPSSRDPYPVVEAMQKLVEAATAESAGKAEREWQGTARSPRLSALTAAPAINIKPIIGGTELTVRYLTHVEERAGLRASLYHAAVDLLGERKSSLSAAATEAVADSRR